MRVPAVALVNPVMVLVNPAVVPVNPAVVPVNPAVVPVNLALEIMVVVLAALQGNRPYNLRDTEGNPVIWEEARKLVLANYHVPEEIKQARRQCSTGGISSKSKRKLREMAVYSTHEAAEAPQPVATTASPGR